MTRIGLALGLILGVHEVAFAQAIDQAAVVNYLYVDGRQVPLTQVQDAPFYRIRGDARVATMANVRESIDRAMGVIPVPTGTDRLAVRRNADTAAAARTAIARLTRIQEADQLRVFTAGGSGALLVEYPEIILQCDEGTTLADVQNYLRRHYQATAVPTGLHPGQFLIRVVTPSHTLWLANQLQSTTAIPVRYADVNFFFAHPSASSPPTPPTAWPSTASPLLSDSGFADQWALENPGNRAGAVRGADIGFARAQRIAPLDASDIKVAVLDYAIDVNHPELVGVIDSVFNAARYSPDKGDADPALRTLDFDVTADHGTACAGIIAALSANGIGISGVAPNAKLIAIQIAQPAATDTQIVSGLTMITALRAARDRGADVISLSWGLSLPDADAYKSVRAEIDLLNTARTGKGIVFVSAAGNDAINFLTPDFPANYAKKAPNLISAGASNWCAGRKQKATCDKEAWTSRFDGNTLFAPGVDILTVTNQRDTNVPNALGNYRQNFNGTSAATPFIAGAAALVIKKHPDWKASEVREHLMRTAAKLGADQKAVDICNALHGVEQCKVVP
jgi:subtilisin family serine protease